MSRRSVRAAGLGRAPRAADPDRYLHHYAHCEVLVIGGGPAGLAAALAASATRRARDPVRRTGGTRRIAAGGTDATIDGWPARTGWTTRWRDARRARLGHAAAAHHGVRLVSRQFHRAGGAGDRSSRRRPIRVCRASGCGRCGRPRGAGGGRDRAAAGVSRQRSAGRDAGRCGARVSAALWREGRRRGSWSRPTDDSAYRGRASALHEAGVTIAGIADARPRRTARR